MTTRPRLKRWLIGGAAILVLLVAGLWAALLAWLPSDAQLAERIGAQFEKSTGVGLAVGGVHWSLMPLPQVVLTDLATQQAQPITVRRIALQPRLMSWLRSRELAFDDIEIEGAKFPRASVRHFRGLTNPDDLVQKNMTDGWHPAAVPIAHLRFRDITWVDRRDIALAYDGDIAFDPRWRPRSGEIRRAGASSAVRLRIERTKTDEDRWRTLIDVGGGTWNGESALDMLADGRMRLTARLQAKGVDVEGTMNAFDRRTPVAGKLSGPTEVKAEGRHAAELLRSLHTRTKFSVAPAQFTRFDLATAVTSLGAETKGKTVLDEFTGVLETQATEDGTVLQYSDLKARSGLLTASGNVRLFDRKLQGAIAVDLVDGVVGVPLQIGGTVDAPLVSMTKGAVAGAAVGSAVLPGVGTAIGARLGQRIERMLEPEPKARQPAPRAAGPRKP